jgi:hypothetical protein
MERILKIVGAALMAAIAVSQFFTNWLAVPWTRWVVVGMALVAVVCYGVAEWLHHRDRKRWEAEQPERTRKLVLEIAEEFEHRKVVQGPPVTESVPKAESLISADDPRIYVSIQPAKEAMFSRTPFVFQNRGKDTAHNVAMEPFKLDRKTVTVPKIELIHADEEASGLPTIDKSDSFMEKNDIFHWLLRDWNANGELIDEWPIRLRVNYEDFNHQKFTAAMTLVFHPIRQIMSESGNWPNYKDVTWEMRDIDFKKN